MNILGLFHSYSDPSAALICQDRVVAFCEEERLLRVKHAAGAFPIQSIRYVLRAGSLTINDIDLIVQAWDCPAYEDGRMAAMYEQVNETYPPTPDDLRYQQNHLNTLGSTVQRHLVMKHLRHEFGDRQFPPLVFVRHHLAHACMAYFHSGMDETLILTLDGSGEWTTTGWWRGQDGKLELLDEITIPHSLGWFYSAITEYLGFQAYDGEYKVMGLAAYGKPDATLAAKLAEIVWYDGKGGFRTNPLLLSRGPRSFSYYFPDTLVSHFGRPPRAEREDIAEWHMNLAHEAQHRLEEIVESMVQFWTTRTGVRRLAIAGGVGLNIKMNGRLFHSGLLDDLFVHPLCADAGISIGAGLAYRYQQHDAMNPQQLQSVAWGPAFNDEEIERVLRTCKLAFTRPPSIERTIAALLAKGHIVGWFQGNMEAGPRALGHRSILADPREIAMRDRVNAVIKYREFWRPFCPSMTREGARRYLRRFTHAPFMILAFEATDRAKHEIPAVVHVDGTVRVQIVDPDSNPRFYRVLTHFAELTNVPCVLNTSFNVKGEPIVCTPHDAIRTFFATGLDALALGSFLLVKGHVP